VTSSELRTSVTLLFADQTPELAVAHDELYPERVDEGIPLSITLLYPFAPVSELGDAHLEALREFFASRAPFEFELGRLGQWEDGDVYAVPEPDGELRELMRALWARFAEFPPYRVPGNDPPPHASLTLDEPADPVSHRARVEQRLERLLPVRLEVTEATLMEETAPNVWRIRETFRLGT
jgi:2'-5' RNA ligase